MTRHTPLLALYLTPREFAMLRQLVEAAVASLEPARADDWEALRKVDRYGVSKRGEQYRGWKRLEESSMSYREAAELIRSYGGEKEALRRTHPDSGGSREEFDRVMRARRLLADAGQESA